MDYKYTKLWVPHVFQFTFIKVVTEEHLSGCLQMTQFFIFFLTCNSKELSYIVSRQHIWMRTSSYTKSGHLFCMFVRLCGIFVHRIVCSDFFLSHSCGLGHESRHHISLTVHTSCVHLFIFYFCCFFYTHSIEPMFITWGNFKINCGTKLSAVCYIIYSVIVLEKGFRMGQSWKEWEKHAYRFSHF